MTFYTVAKILQSYELNPEKITVRIDEVAADISGTSADLVEGDTYTVLQLLYGLMLPSGNDAAVALARWGGSILQGDSKDFIGLMNRYAI
jgi:D-alanyl-D-alanine carboxypeptidase (penicillin-binding protein 5/6)